MDRHLALQCFCRVVETCGFAAAARDLDCAPSMVTNYVQYLETWTGSRLLARTTRRMQLTEGGERFYACCRRVLDDTDETLSALRSASGGLSGRLVVAVPVSLTLAFLKGPLHAFQAAHPGLELELRLSDRPVDLVRDGIDVALRGQVQLEEWSLVAVALMTMQRAVAASPDFGRRHGKPRGPAELDGRHCLPCLLGSDALRCGIDRRCERQTSASSVVEGPQWGGTADRGRRQCGRSIRGSAFWRRDRASDRWRPTARVLRCPVLDGAKPPVERADELTLAVTEVRLGTHVR